MTELERLQKNVVDTEAAYQAASSATRAALLESHLIPDRTYAAELAASDDAADALDKAIWLLEYYLQEHGND